MNRLIVGGLVLLMVLACGAPVPTADPVKTKKVASKEQPEAAAVVDTYYYNPAGKRDPFQSFIAKRSSAKTGIDNDAPPLQRWDVDKFTVRGVIWATQSPTALLIDPEGIGHVVRLGSYVGRNWGKVTSIADGCVVVTEEYQTLDGELVVNPVQMCFPGEESK